MSSCSPVRRPQTRCCGGPHAPSGHRSRPAEPTSGSYRRYRNERACLEALLDPQHQPPAELAASIQELNRRSAVVVPAVRELRALADAGQLSVAIPELAMSLAHMHVNRMLRSAQRAQELILYELLDRVYGTQAARRRP